MNMQCDPLDPCGDTLPHLVSAAYTGRSEVRGWAWLWSAHNLQRVQMLCFSSQHFSWTLLVEEEAGFSFKHSRILDEIKV